MTHQDPHRRRGALLIGALLTALALGAAVAPATAQSPTHQIEYSIWGDPAELASQQAEHQATVERLSTIPGVGVRAAQQIIAEVGPKAEALRLRGSWLRGWAPVPVCTRAAGSR